MLQTVLQFDRDGSCLVPLYRRQPLRGGSHLNLNLETEPTQSGAAVKEPSIFMSTPMDTPPNSLTACVRDSTALVMSQASVVRIDQIAIDRLSERLIGTSRAPGWDSSVHFFDGGPLSAKYLLVLDALNFCFWPDPGLNYVDLARGLREAVLADRSVLDADRLVDITGDEIDEWFGRPVWRSKERAQLVAEVGKTLSSQYDGSVENLVESAGGSADRLVAALVHGFQGFADHVDLDGRRTCFYKRAQIFVADLWGAFRGNGLGAFHDIDALTTFADYRVPQLLRHVGAINYEPGLAADVDSETELVQGGREEIEIRSATVQAVERLRLGMARHGRMLNSVELDWWLWHLAEDEASSGRIGPHHRVRTIAY